MNDRKPAELSISDRVIAKLVGARYDEPASSDARTRITAFFRKHLNGTA
jgi:carboxymethylenebutenolidase